MKIARKMGFFLIAVLLVAAPAFSQVESWQQIEQHMPALPPFHPPEPKRVVLSNGMVIFLQEDHELPLIDAVARIRGGSRREPADKVGLVSLLGEVWRTGGTQSQTGDQLDDFLEARAAKVETAPGIDSTSVSLSCLKQDFDDVFKIFNDVLRNPEFRPDKLDIAKRGAFDAISRRNDDNSEISYREAIKLAYGPQNPYARVPEFATIAAVTREDLINWHKTYVQPNDIIFGIVGDFDSSEMEAKLRQAFGSWPKGPALPKDDIHFTPAKPGYYSIPKPDVNQSLIRMVALGTTKDNPDYYAIQVFNEAFGGGFSSRLFQDLRTTKHLAYAVGGGIGTSYDHPGVLQLVIGTKSNSTVEAIQGLYQEVGELNTRPLTDEEIKRAKDSILNSFIFNFDTPDKVLRERMGYEFYGYPQDFLERYRIGIEKVTKADVERVAAKYLHKDQLAVLVVGNDAEFDKPLSTLGEVKTVNITIPPPPDQKAGGGQ